jgi:2-dehydropantoate 2-reductase
MGGKSMNDQASLSRGTAARGEVLRVAVLGGAGAMGGIFGTGLAAAGHSVTLIDVSDAAVDTINRDGFSVEAKDGSTRIHKVRASKDPASVGEVDLIINFVKCYHTEAAIRSAAPMIGKDTMVLSLQNGWGNTPRIAGIVGEERVLVGLTYHSGTLLGPGRIKHPGQGMTFVGELNGGPTPRLARIAAALQGAGFEVTQSERILDEVWKKLALNCCTLPTAALLRFTADALVKHESMLELMRAILCEVVAVARAQSIAIEEEERWEAITGLLNRAIGARASMLQDVEAGRRTEIEVINGAISAAGRKLGIATPTNDAMVWLIQSLQDSYKA